MQDLSDLFSNLNLFFQKINLDLIQFDLVDLVDNPFDFKKIKIKNKTHPISHIEFSIYNWNIMYKSC
jgi:hypothetical protein